MGFNSPAHDFVCEQNSAHLWILVLSLVRYGLRGKKQGVDWLLVVEIVRRWLDAKLANLFGDGVNESSVEVLLRADPCRRGNTKRRGGKSKSVFFSLLTTLVSRDTTSNTV